ncbi:hypothetical protein AM499_04880 [Bacillus sp. FJAT-22090]|uniref:hypothetical protein n=1 Tax=Bacillus sp. FJAT-22090 TaxID=1581038 RepID=UPI0006AFABD8|nr:hypothetical protein [Bacillus sp. FJAT-22090]ALC85225.1 hypothetical protein AM499_04880 [Bacillus sp. FJAT-22090]
MEGYISIVFMIIGLLVLYYVIQAAVTKGINNSIVGKLLEGKDEGLSVNEILNKYGKIEDNKKS